MCNASPDFMFGLFWGFFALPFAAFLIWLIRNIDKPGDM